jgi:hypothetical protein
MRPVGDESALGRFTLPITDTSTGINVDAYFDLVFARENRGIAILSFLDTATPFDEALRGRLTRILVTRLKAGLESGTLGGTSG